MKTETFKMLKWITFYITLHYNFNIFNPTFEPYHICLSFFINQVQYLILFNGINALGRTRDSFNLRFCNPAYKLYLLNKVFSRMDPLVADLASVGIKMFSRHMHNKSNFFCSFIDLYRIERICIRTDWTWEEESREEIVEWEDLDRAAFSCQPSHYQSTVKFRL